jgi:hypothetical protein
MSNPLNVIRENLDNSIVLLESVINSFGYPLSDKMTEELNNLIKIKKDLHESKIAFTNSSDCLPTKKQSDVESDDESDVRLNNDPIDYFKLEEDDEPKFPRRSENHPNYDDCFRCWDGFQQLKVVLRYNLKSIIEDHLTRLFKNRQFWHTNYMFCITKMRDNALQFCNDENVDRIILLTRFILQGM